MKFPINQIYMKLRGGGGGGAGGEEGEGGGEGGVYLLQNSFANNKHFFMTRDKNQNICRKILYYKRNCNHQLMMAHGGIEILQNVFLS